MSSDTRTPDWAGAIAALAFAGTGLFAIVESLAMTPLGAIFPRTIGAVLLGLSLLQLVRCLTGRGGASVLEEGETGGSTLRRLILAVVLMLWVMLFPVVGFVVTSLVAALGLMVIAEFEALTPRATVLRVAIVSAMVFLFHWLMVAVLHIPMPRALLF